MKRWRTLAPWALIYLITLIALLCQPSALHTREFNHAFFVWSKNPTPENEAALNLAYLHKQRDELIVYCIISAIPASMLAAIYYNGRYAVRKIGERRA